MASSTIANDTGAKDTGPPETGDAARLWAALGSASDAAGFCQAWLDLHCARTPGAEAGLVLLGDGAGVFGPAAMWPAPTLGQPPALDHLRVVAEQALGTAAHAVLTDPADPARTGIAYPIDVQGQLRGAVVLALRNAGAADLQAALRELHWAVGWIVAMIWQHRGEEEGGHARLSVAAMDVLAAVEEQGPLPEAAMALCNALAVALKAEQVSFALVRRDDARMLATSHGAWFRKKSDVTEVLEAAMDEALDQGRTIMVPQAPGDNAIVLQQERLRSAGGRSAVLSVPVQDRGLPVGVLTIERAGDAPVPDPREVLFAETVAGLVAPLIALKAREERWISGRIRSKGKDGLKALFGPRHPLAKAIGVVALVALILLLLPVALFRISAEASLEGRVQRAAAVPFSGFIARSQARAGDVVQQGQLLATLEDRDLLLDRAKSAGEVDQYDRRYREALARHERAEMNLFGAQLRQAQAQLALTDYKLARTRITAPISGVLVSGDVSQLVGTPVKEGEVLFQVAPLEGFRVALQVEEGDVGFVRPGQRGRFAPTGLAGDTVDFRVTKVTSVTRSEEGKNTFRVEAELLGGQPPTLRPGMEGIAKVGIDRRPLLWVWTRGLRNWVRLFLWKWLP